MFAATKSTPRGPAIPSLFFESNRRGVKGADDPFFKATELPVALGTGFRGPPPHKRMRPRYEVQRRQLFFRSQVKKRYFVARRRILIEPVERLKKLLLGLGRLH